MRKEPTSPASLCTSLCTALCAILTLLTLSTGTANARAGVDFLSYSLNDITVLIVNDTEHRFQARLFPTLKDYPDAQKALLNDSFAGTVRTFVIRNGNRTILVDSGWGTEHGTAGRTRETISRAGIRPDDITDILLTHLDIDHVSGLMEQNVPVYTNATLRLSREEYNAWITRGHVRDEASEQIARTAVAAYEKAGRLALFNWGDEVLPAVTALDGAGHTPGHTVFQITSKDASLMLLGDLLHAADLQLRHPEASSVYDHDPARAAASRTRILTRCAQEKCAVAGAHILPVGIPHRLPEGGFVIE